VALALLIKIESPDGPIIFSQSRTGKGGKRFKMYKFRSMVPNAEELKKELAHLNELKWPDFKITNDPRVTRIGNILRRTSLDELPQLLNVIKGDMSLYIKHRCLWLDIEILFRTVLAVIAQRGAY
jgi:lipopolysaccharide/colanic/teichoic acid biosynthesis glycosyltransferase